MLHCWGPGTLRMKGVARILPISLATQRYNVFSLVILLGHMHTPHLQQRHMATTKRNVYVLTGPVKRWLKARAPNRVVIKLNDLVCAMTIRKCRQKLQNQQLS